MNTQSNSNAGSGCSSHDLLASWVTPESIKAAKSDFDEDVPGEVLVMAAALWSLAESTTDHANNEAAEGFDLTAEETENRANRYHDSYWSLVEMWR